MISNLHPDHRQDLHKSGISDEYVAEAGIHSVSPHLIGKILGWNAPVESLMAFPYPGTDFTRYKLFPAYTNIEGHTQKYTQKKGSPVRLYVPPGFRCDERTWRVTEGEKKALKGTQENLNVCGLGGIWSHSLKGSSGKAKLIDDLIGIPWDKKKVEIIPDGDFQTNEHVCHAVYRLGLLLEEQKARVSVVCLPIADKLDDYLIKHSIDDFLTLHRMTLDDPFFRRYVVKEKGLSEAIQQSTISLNSFIQKKIPSREFYLKPWLGPGTLAMIYSPRGLGKTWLGYLIALAVTRKLSIGNWNAEKAAGVLLFDGEMGEDERQGRLKQLLPGLPHETAPFHILASDTMQREGWPTPNLTEQKWRDAVSAFLMDGGIYKVLILDNLASLTPGLDENVKVEWDSINQWLLSLRFMGIAVILIHHAGKSGEQRGTSGREDNLDITIKLTKPAGYKPEDGAYFDIEFTKARAVFGDGAAPFSLKIIQTGADQLTWTTEDAGTSSREKIIALLGAGIPQREIPEILHCAKSWVSGVKRKAIKDGYLTDKGKFTDLGKESYGGVSLDGLL